MQLTQILSKIDINYKLFTNHSSQNEISAIVSRADFAIKNSIFVGLLGLKIDGASFSEQAIKNGASTIIVDENSNYCYQHLLQKHQINIIVGDAKKLLMALLPIFYHSLPRHLYAITGTNGKTSVVDYIRQILGLLKKKSASIGTIGIKTNFECKSDFWQTNLTTPDLASLYHNLALLKQQGVDDVAIEASSIGLEQNRLANLPFSVGCFTNFSQDHLDYHGDMQHYFTSKMLLFSDLLTAKNIAILNADIAEYQQILQVCHKNNLQVASYGKNIADLQLISFINNQLMWQYQQQKYVATFLPQGQFQAYNLLCALLSVSKKHNISANQMQFIASNLSKIEAPQGRMQLIGIYNQAKIFIDFAHSPDGLLNVLSAAKQVSHNRLLVLFGCGGNRDIAKRPLMGKVCSDLADVVIVTDDNPRLEDAGQIRQQILQGCNLAKTIVIANRQTAIKQAIAMLLPNDILILAGKGHEKYQIIKNQYLPFDEEKIVLNAISP
jgi:UDP-N-acetylmuramoyl-L-alanyl-D-glutamate--2,6-diaminopimelate ligase